MAQAVNGTLRVKILLCFFRCFTTGPLLPYQSMLSLDYFHHAWNYLSRSICMNHCRGLGWEFFFICATFFSQHLYNIQRGYFTQGSARGLAKAQAISVLCAYETPEINIEVYFIQFSSCFTDWEIFSFGLFCRGCRFPICMFPASGVLRNLLAGAELRRGAMAAVFDLMSPDARPL